MNLSSLVHANRIRQDQTAGYFSHPPAPTEHHTMATALMSNSYKPTNRNYSYITAPQAPPSPPVEEIPKCSLPSISSLLGIADNGQPQEQPQQQPQTQTTDCPSHQQHASQPTQPTQPTQSIQPTTAITASLPPTPPMQFDAGFDGRQSPSAACTSSYSVISAPNTYYFTAASSINNIDPHSQRQSIPRRISMPYVPQPQFSMSPYSISPSAQSINAYYSSPMQPTPPPSSQPSQISGLFYQRPLPQNFPPLMPIAIGSSTNPWQHHHYISPSSQAAFQQSQDRYICGTCTKAFSRPSSLRIHSHSHTGEKPFKCAHAGCGKAFSVRSNMKRHERGCHSFERPA